MHGNAVVKSERRDETPCTKERLKKPRLRFSGNFKTGEVRESLANAVLLSPTRRGSTGREDKEGDSHYGL